MKSPHTSKTITLTLAISALSVFSLCKAADETYTGTPYGGKPQEIPGTIEAEHYDVAPGNVNGIAYNRKGTPKSGAARTTGDCIGLGSIGTDHVSTTGEKLKGGVYVGWTDAGDWWKYTVKVNEAGTYNLGAHIAAGAKGAKISVTFTPVTPAGAVITTGPIEIPTTAGFQPSVEVYHVWETLDKLAEIKLTPGVYVMTVKIEAVAGMNIDSYTLTMK